MFTSHLFFAMGLLTLTINNMKLGATMDNLKIDSRSFSFDELILGGLKVISNYIFKLLRKKDLALIS